MLVEEIGNTNTLAANNSDIPNIIEILDTQENVSENSFGSDMVRRGNKLYFISADGNYEKCLYVSDINGENKKALKTEILDEI